MAGRFVRASIVARLRAEREAGRAIYDALCGSGITAKMAARGGAEHGHDPQPRLFPHAGPELDGRAICRSATPMR